MVVNLRHLVRHVYYSFTDEAPRTHQRVRCLIGNGG